MRAGQVRLQYGLACRLSRVGRWYPCDRWLGPPNVANYVDRAPFWELMLGETQIFVAQLETQCHRLVKVIFA